MNNKSLQIAKDVIGKEIEGLNSLIDILDNNFVQLIDLLYDIKGRVIVSGMGKSGHIARKIAATMASTGTAAFFVHPAEASHGDLGMIMEGDAVILLSNSGETAELTDIINYCTPRNIPLIAIVRRKSSTLVDSANIAFILPEIQEASPVSAPTTSTTMMLAWGDAIAMALLDKKHFNKQDFNKFHPGGKLGVQFTMVKSLMRRGKDLPIIHEDDLMSKAIMVISSKKIGCAAVVDDQQKAQGIITDGDLRRHMDDNMLQKKSSLVMSKNPLTIGETSLAIDALEIMNDKNITSLIVVDNDNKLQGIIHIHDILN